MLVKLYYDLETKACGSFEAWWNETELGEYEGMGLSWAPLSQQAITHMQATANQGSPTQPVSFGVRDVSDPFLPHEERHVPCHGTLR